METLAVITARGGSKRVPRKNIRLLNGKPLIEYAIDAAKESKLVTRIVVTTDDAEIAKVALSNGIEVIDRPTELAEDLSTDLSVFQHALLFLLENEDYEPQEIVHLRPTAPFVTGKRIDESVEWLRSFPNADSVRSICLPKRPPSKMWTFHGKAFGIIPLVDYEKCSLPSQILPTPYMQNGVVDCIRYGTIMRRKSMTGNQVIGMIMHEEESWCIDTEFDWKVAEGLCKLKS